MARKKSEPVYKGGYNAKEMTEIDLDTLNRMNRSELSKVVSRMTDVTKKRLKTLEKNEEFTPAYYGLKKKSMNGDLSVKGKNINELRAMYKQQKSFITAKTSTMKGVEAVKQAEAKRLGVSFSNKDEAKAFWQQYSKFIETNEGKQALYNMGSNEVQQKVADMMINEDMDEDEILQTLQDMYEDEPEEDYDDFFDEFYDLDDF